MKSGFTLKVSKLEKPTAISFDYRPAAVRKWVESLPMGHIGEATRQIFSALRETNGLEIEGRHRFELLEALWQPVASILPALAKHFATTQFPTPEKALKIADLSNNLQTELAIGYHLVMDSTEPGSWFNRKAQQRTKVTSLHRTLHYLRGIANNFRTLNQPYPEGLWRELHRTYQEAQKRNWLAEVVEEPGETNRVSIDQAYKQVLLLSLLPNHQFGPEQLESVYRSMPVWSGEVSLIEPGHGRRDSTPFCVPINVDAPPLVDGERCEALRSSGVRILHLDTGRIKERINNYLSNTHGNSVHLPNETRITLDALRVLLSCWGEPRARGEDRKSEQFEVEVVIGLTAIYRIMSQRLGRSTGQEEAAEEGEHGPSTDTIELSGIDTSVEQPKINVKKGEFIATSEEAENSWGRVYDQSYGRAKSWTDSIREKEYHSCIGTVSDYSQHGYRLSVPLGKVENIKVGELVGVLDRDAGDWRVGSIRWIRHDEIGLQLGIQVHLAGAVPVDLKVHHKEGESAPIGSLLGIHEKVPLLVIPALPVATERKYGIADGAITASIDLLERAAGSSVFQAHHFRIKSAERRGEAPASDLIRELARPFLPQEASAGQSKDGDDYSSLWSSL